MKKPVQLTENVFLIDDFDLSMPERTGTYVLTEDKVTLIETSASPSIPYILEGLQTLGVSPGDISYIIVTHIHLDHAGGAGLMLQRCPNAKVVVHPKGARHLADPSRLIMGAKAVYGDKFSQLFDPIVEIPEDRLLIKGEGDTLEISEKLTLRFLDTPGHANHHFSIYHPLANGIFTGDTAGIYYPQLDREGIEFYLPTTSPNQFDPEKMLYSMSRFQELGVERIFFGHYGMSENSAEAFRQVESWLEVFIEEAKHVVTKEKHPEKQVEQITQKLYDKIKTHLTQRGLTNNHPIYELLYLDVNVSAMGLVHYLNKNTGEANKMKDIIVYTQNDCPPCQIIKMFLTEFGFSYTEKNINLDDQSKQELTENYNSYSTPTIVIGEEIITGFDLEKLKRVLEIKD